MTVTENGTVYFKAVDEAGNESESSYQVGNIDKIPPEMPSVSADVIEPTSGCVHVSADFSADSAIREYSTDGQDWKTYSAPVTMTENGTVFFRSKDAAGNVSEIASYTVTNINPLPDHVSSGVVITSGQSATVADGWTYYDTTVNDRGEFSILSGGVGSSTTVNSGGSMFVSGGGIANDTTVNESGYMAVCSGGTANSTTVNESGYMYVYSGGVATGTTVNSNGFAFVYAGGVANDAVVIKMGYMVVSSGGTANSAMLDNAQLYVSSGGEVNSTTVNGGRINVYGGVANSTMLNSGFFLILSGGVANGASVSEKGYIIVSSGGVANNITAHGGSIEIREDGTVNSAMLKSGGRLLASGAANFTTVDYLGCLNVYAGGEANSTTVNDGGTFDILSGGIANDVVINCEKEMINVQDEDYIWSFGTGSGKVHVFSGGALNRAVVSGGYLFVDTDGSADQVTVNSYGSMVLSGGTAAGVTVNNGGTFEILSGGMADGATIEGFYDIAPGAGEDDGEYYYTRGYGMIRVSSGGVVDHAVLNGGYLNVFSSGTAENTTVNVCGYLAVSSGGVATNVVENGGYVLIDDDADVTFAENEISDLNLYYTAATVHSATKVNNATLDNSYLFVYAGGRASNTTVYSDGRLDISSGGNASNTTVKSRGRLDVASGGNAFRATINSGGLASAYGIVYTAVVNSGGRFYVCFGGVANSTTVNAGGNMHLFGGTANSTTINNSGTFDVLSGGVANDVVINIEKELIHIVDEDYIWSYSTGSGTVRVSDGGTVNRAVVSGGSLIAESGGVADQATINNYGNFILSGGVATNTTFNGGGCMWVYEGGVTNNATIEGCYECDPEENEDAGILIYTGGAGTIVISAGGSASGTTLNGGFLDVHDSGVAEDTVVNACGTLKVSSGGVATNVVENGGFVYVEDGADVTFAANKISGLDLYYASATVHAGTVASDVRVFQCGELAVCSGGKLTGQTIIDGGAVSAYSGAILDFDIAELVPGAAARINNLSKISGWSNADFTLTVSGMQANGIYSLAEGASGFDKTISVMNTSGESLGTLTVGETVNINGTDYTLKLSDGTLSVDITESVGPEPGPEAKYTFSVGDFNGDGKDMLAVQSGSTVTIYMDGMPWGRDVVLDSGWSVAGVGDFSGDGFDDFLRVHDSGLVMSENSNGFGTFSPQVLNFLNEGWDILGIGDFNGNGTDDVLIANPTAASETVGLLGYWESGATWTLINGYSAEWEMVATGDFNGDGKCDMLWRNEFVGEGDLVYNAYCTWIVDDPVDWRMVSVANPAEWNFLCAGDFNGDKMNDIAMINNVGVVGIWGVEDGWLSTWSILSAVTPEWQLAGVADFNGDGTDDIAWSNTDTGLVGCWQIENKELASWQTICTLG